MRAMQLAQPGQPLALVELADGHARRRRGAHQDCGLTAGAAPICMSSTAGAAVLVS